jgi:hypothetical protein
MQREVRDEPGTEADDEEERERERGRKENKATEGGRTAKNSVSFALFIVVC